MLTYRRFSVITWNNSSSIVSKAQCNQVETSAYLISIVIPSLKSIRLSVAEKTAVLRSSATAKFRHVVILNVALYLDAESACRAVNLIYRGPIGGRYKWEIRDGGYKREEEITAVAYLWLIFRYNVK